MKKEPTPLSAETVLSLPPEARDRAMFPQWEKEQDDASTMPSEAPREAAGDDLPPASTASTPTIPDVSERVLTRLVMLYNRIWFLSTLPQNDRGGSFASNAWLCDKIRMPDGDRPNVATVRRWIAILETNGWIERVKKARDRVIECRVTPTQIVALLPRFARYFRTVLRGIKASPLISSERRLNNNSQHSGEAPAKKRPLTAEEEKVVVQAANAGMVRTDAEATVRAKGTNPISDALAVLRHQREKAHKAGQERIEDAGAYLAGLVKRAVAGTLQMPKALLEARDRAERKAERDKAAANRVYAAPEAPNTPKASKPAAPTVDESPLLALPEEHVAKLESRARDVLESAGGARAMMVRKIKSWRDGAGGVLRAEMMRLLSSQPDILREQGA